MRRHWRARLAILAAIVVVFPGIVAAQTGWTIDVGGERSAVTINDLDTVWSSERLQIGWVREEAAGWFGGVERQGRFDRSDLVFSTSGYRRLGDWTLGGGAAGTADADFWFRRSVEAELSRRIAGTLVASGGYRVMEFSSATVRQAQPALTWYHRRSEVQGRLFITRNSNRSRSSTTGLVQSSFQVTPRVRLWGAVARGDRIFDIASLATGTATAWMVRGTLRIGIGQRNAIEIGGGYAREEPRFEQRTLAFSVRRSF